MINEILTRKQILDLFQVRLCQGYEEYCKAHNLESNFGGLITYIIDHEMIQLSFIQKFTILKEFEQIQSERQTMKSQIVENLADRFNLSERTVWNILRHQAKK